MADIASLVLGSVTGISPKLVGSIQDHFSDTNNLSLKNLILIIAIIIFIIIFHQSEHASIINFTIYVVVFVVIYYFVVNSKLFQSF